MWSEESSLAHFAVVVPKLAAQVVELWDSGDIKGARDVAHRLAAWTSAAFVESNPLPAKAALAMMGKLENILRLPRVPMKDSFADVVRQALVTAGALSK